MLISHTDLCVLSTILAESGNTPQFPVHYNHCREWSQIETEIQAYITKEMLFKVKCCW